MLLSLVPAWALTPELEAFTEADAGGGFGLVVAAAGDVDADGLGDLLVGHTANTGAQPIATLFLASGPRDASTQRFTGDSFAYGSTLAGLGDVDGDGAPDVAIGDWDDDEVEVRHGEEGQLGSGSYLRTSGADKLGYLLTAAGDMDGDGLADLASYAPDASELGRVYVFAGSPDGLASCGVFTPVAYVSALTGVGDMDGDGLGELAYATASTAEVHVVAGGVCGGDEATTTLQLGNATTRMGAAPGGDLDGDGLADALAVAAFTDGMVRASRVALSPAPEGTAIATWHLSDGAYEVAVAAPGDVDGDGAPEVAVSVAGPAEDHGFVDLVSVDGAVRAHVRDIADEDGLATWSSANGWTLAAPGDVDGDGLPDLLVGGDRAAYVLYARPDEPEPVGKAEDAHTCGCAGPGSPGAWPLALMLLARRRRR
jgi:uncharacterized protein (TIGR03382 family)